MSQLRAELDRLVDAFVDGVMSAIGEVRLEQLVEADVVERAKQVARKSAARRRGTHSVCPPPSPATTADSAPSRVMSVPPKQKAVGATAPPPTDRPPNTRPGSTSREGARRAQPPRGPRYVVEAPDGTVLSGHDDVTPALRANNADAKAMRVRRMVDGEVVSSKRTSEVIKPTESPW